MYQEFDRLISFASVHHALKAEKLLAGAGIAAAAVPTPRDVDISCGQCLLFGAENERRVLTLLESSGVRWSKLFHRNYAAKVYEKLAEQEGR